MLVPTQDIAPTGRHPAQAQLYNALDCMITHEVHAAMTQLESPNSRLIYNFERALQAPALEMMLRGFQIDSYERRKAVEALEADILRFGGTLSPKDKADPESILQRMAWAVWDGPLNPRSSSQLKALFYKVMGLPEIWTSFKGKRSLSMNREALEKLWNYHYARPFVNAVLAIRDLYKQHEVLTTEIDPDGRMRTSYNIAGTETGRWSSSRSSSGTGTNLQNIARPLRRVFVADEGWKLCGIDLEQAESREVGWLCGVLFDRWQYLDACEGGDLHTYTCRLIWPNLGWTGNAASDRRLAETLFYREFTYRDMSKRGGHGSNYLGTPFTMARHLKVPRKLIVDFQAAYFSAFPEIPLLHQWVAQQIQTKRALTTAFGRERHFFSHPNDDATLREAVAFLPQGNTGDRLNLALYRIWALMPNVQLLAQVHDAVYFQYLEEEEQEVIPKALSLVDIPLEHNGRTFTIPGEAKVGWNWGDFDPNPGPRHNPQGLAKWRGSDQRTRASITQTIM